LWLVVLYVAALVAVVTGWFAALVIGRLPRGTQTYLTSVLTYSLRVNAYSWLLVGQYPGFRLDAPDHPVALEVPPAGRLNRWAVLFRFFLGIPAWIVSSLVTTGRQAIGIFVWLIVLVLGRMPRPLAEAVAATLRFEARAWGYTLLLTPTYPKALFGDKPQALDVTGGNHTALSSSSSPAPVAPPRTARLVLSKAGKRVLVTFLVVGIVINVATQVLQATTVSTVQQRVEVHNDVVNAYNDLVPAVTTLLTATANTAACTPVSLGPCRGVPVASLVDPALGKLRAFERTISGLDLPSSARPAAQQVTSLASAFVTQLTALADQSGPITQRQLTSVQQAAMALDSAVRALIDALS
jgi:hypothetical protein